MWVACWAGLVRSSCPGQSDAVVSSIADRMNIPKADILGATEVEEGAGSQNPAVKLALAETHVIQETRRYFEDVRTVSFCTRPSYSTHTARCRAGVAVRTFDSPIADNDSREEHPVRYDG